MAERLTFEGNFCEIARCKETRWGKHCPDGACSQRKVWERLKQYEDSGAVEVVRCKDCRLGEPDMIVNGYKDDFWCKYYEHPKPADGFCEKGKRRTNENEPEGTRALENGSVDSLPVVR